MNLEKLKSLKKQVTPYENSNLKISIRQMINTFVPFVLLWLGAYYSLSISYWLTLVLSIVNGGFLVRIFIIFHDCCHYSFFKNKKANQIIGTITGVITMVPYSLWQHEHCTHHATSGNLDKRGIGDLWMLTISEYCSASLIQRFLYRMYRNPFVLFLLGPIYQFLIAYRFNKKGANQKERNNTHLTNFFIVLGIAMMCILFGWKAFLLVQVPVFLVSGTLGVWLFYVQHHFEDSYFEKDDEWEYVRAATEGSSFYKLPKLIQWLTGNIGYHHVHHLSPKIPNYSLEKAHNNTPPLQQVPTVTIWTSLLSLRFHLWDEDKKRFVAFKESKILRKNKQKAAI